MDTHAVMDIFMQPESFSSFVSSLETIDAATMQKLLLVEQNLSHVQDWFDDNVANTYGEVVSELNAIMENGRAVIRAGKVATCHNCVGFLACKRRSHKLTRARAGGRLVRPREMAASIKLAFMWLACLFLDPRGVPFLVLKGCASSFI